MQCAIASSGGARRLPSPEPTIGRREGMETTELRPGYEISRVIRGGWQLAGGHGAIDRDRAVDDLIAACDAGIFTFDCADIYTGVEELIGGLDRKSVV